MSKMNRREFGKLLGGTAVAVPLAAVAASLPSVALSGGVKMLDPASATAAGLQYTETSDSDSKCSNCLLFTAADGGHHGMCSIFPGEHVAADGWCISHSPKPA